MSGPDNTWGETFLLRYQRRSREDERLRASNLRLRAALEKCQAVLMASLYKPGPNEPPVLRDGVIDKALRMAREALDDEP